MVNVEGAEQFLCCLLAVHISVLWDGQRIQDTVAGNHKQPSLVKEVNETLLGAELIVR